MGIDKLKHFTAGMIIFWASFVLFGVAFREFWPHLSMLLVIVVGVGKELVWDWLLERGYPCIFDATCTVLGGFVFWVWFF